MLGNFACSTSVLFIKASSIHPVLLAAYRLILAAVVLLPWFIRAWVEHREAFSLRDLNRAIAPGILLGLHFVSWIMGARMTVAVNSTAIVNLIPLATPALLFAVAKEKLRPAEWRGSIVALCGVALLTLSDYRINTQYFLGDVVCFVSMLVCSVYLVLGRKNRDVVSIWLYLVPMYAVAGIFCLLISFALEAPFSVAYKQRELWLLLGITLVPTVIGHSAVNNAMRHFRGQVVSLSNLSQPLFAGVMAYPLLGEVPGAMIYPAGLLIALGAGLALSDQLRSSPAKAG
jgi:drug/metabolite transporter (DMT)-like permease